MQKTYHELAEKTKVDGERLRLIATLGNSEDAVYHYRLVCEDWTAGKQLLLENSFDRHEREGIVFLLEWLRVDESDQQYTDVVHLAAKTLSQSRHRDFCVVLSKELTTLLPAGSEAKEGALRWKCIITPGWVGSAAEIDVSIDFLRGDPDTLCCAWAVASLTQLPFHAVAVETVREKAETVFAETIQKKGDLRAAGIMLETAWTFLGKKWISVATAEAAKSRAILKAGKSVLRFLTRCSVE